MPFSAGGHAAPGVVTIRLPNDSQRGVSRTAHQRSLYPQGGHIEVMYVTDRLVVA